MVITIGDTGCGMSPEVQSRMYTPFFTTKPPGVGTRLGLSICHRLVTSFGGELSCASEVGRGTEFRVALRLATEPLDGARTHQQGPRDAASRSSAG